MTGYLRTVNEKMNPYAAAAEPLAELLEDSGDPRILDLCSGSGGPWPTLREGLKEHGVHAEVTCSDLWPNQMTADWIDQSPGFRFHREPVSALQVPEEFKGTRTLFTALHHFEPPQVEAMFLDAQQAGRYFAAFEITHRSWLGLLSTTTMPILALLLMPFVKPRRLLPLVLSYLPPIVPLAIGWDGTVSTLRSYRAHELEAIIQRVTQTSNSSGYEWQVMELESGTPLPMTCVFGRPSRDPAEHLNPGLAVEAAEASQ